MKNFAVVFVQRDGTSLVFPYYNIEIVLHAGKQIHWIQKNAPNTKLIRGFNFYKCVLSIVINLLILGIICKK
jgi:hypothetical protein